VKISRRSVKATVAATELVVSGDKRARWLFNWVAKALPQSELPDKEIENSFTSRKIL
jgi:hypothetical protein